MLQATSRETEKQQQVYFDVSVDGEPKGRLVIQLSGDAPVGTKRFAQLSQGLNGVGYRLSKFDGIAQVLIIPLQYTVILCNTMYGVVQTCRRPLTVWQEHQLFSACLPPALLLS